MPNIPKSDNKLSITGTPTAGQAIVATSSTNATWQSVAASSGFNQTAIKTSAYTASPNDLVLADTTAGAFTITLPTAPADKTTICIKKVDASTTFQLTVACGGSDTFYAPTGTSLVLRLQGQSGTWVYNSSNARWISTGNGIQLAYLVDNFTDQDIYGQKSLYGNLYMTEGTNIGTGTNTGTKIGTATTQKIGFFNSTPIVKPSGDIATALSNLGLIDSPTGGGGGTTSPLTTKGDIWTYSTTNARLPVGSNGQVLMADSAQTTGIKWASAAGGGDMLASVYDPAGIIQQLVGITATQTITGKTFGGFTMTDATDIVLTTTTGTKIGTATTQKLGFFNATPVTQRSATADIGTALSDIGIRASGTAYSISTSGTISANGNLTVGGAATVGAGYRATTVTRSASTSITVTSTWNSLCNATSGALNFTLPAASSINGQMLWFKKIDATANTVTITRAGSDTIDGATTYVLSTQYKYVEIVSDGVSAWYIRGNN